MIPDAAASRPNRRVHSLRAALSRVGLPAWFVVIDMLWIAKPDVFGIDARHYQRAASAWLDGGNPYGVMEGAVPYLAGPHTLALYVPTSVLPLPLAVGIWMAIGVAAAVWMVRRLGAPIWWVLFPPLAHSLWNGNPQSLALALLVLGGTIPSVLATVIKLYTGLVLLFQPRLAIAAGIALLVMLPFVPWQSYLTQATVVADHIGTSWNGSAWRVPVLVLPTVLALWALRRHDGEWYSVPAIFPLTQFYYVAMATPAVVGRPIIAAMLALPVPLLTPFIVLGLAVRLVFGVRLARRFPVLDRIWGGPATSALDPSA